MADSTGFIIHTDVYDADSRAGEVRKINASMFGCRKLINGNGRACCNLIPVQMVYGRILQKTLECV